MIIAASVPARRPASRSPLLRCRMHGRHCLNSRPRLVECEALL